MKKNRDFVMGAVALTLLLVFGVTLSTCGGKTSQVQPSSGGDPAAELKQAAGAAKDAMLAAVKSGDAAAFAQAVQGKTAAELADLFTSDAVSPGGDFSYDLNKEETGIIIKGYTGKDTVLVFPATIEGYPVVQLGDGSGGMEVGSDVVSVVIPEGVQIISNNFFFYTHDLQTVVFPSTLTTIEHGAFGSNKITSVELNHTALTTLEDRISTLIENLDLSQTPLKTIGKNDREGTFWNNLKTVKLPDSVMDIGDRAFAGCYNLTDINLPASLKNIGWAAFSDCRELYNLTIPDSLTSVSFDVDDDYTFSGCGKLPLATRRRLQSLGYKGKF
ncbi:MAG: leucine-rich repeat domain-containing protein [Treponema sp.]|jgi:hypothetical protein|nr:leucine-rich repeat domain-containing protein [Treponema sp.]